MSALFFLRDQLGAESARLGKGSHGQTASILPVIVERSCTKMKMQLAGLAGMAKAGPVNVAGWVGGNDQMGHYDGRLLNQVMTGSTSF